MSDLWAQFSLQIINVSWTTTDAPPYTPTTVDDEANSIQTINGNKYLVSITTDVDGGFVYENLSTGNASSVLNGSGADQYLYNPVNGVYAYTPWSAAITAAPASLSGNINALNDVLPTEASDEEFQNAVLSIGSIPLDEPIEGYGVTVNNVLNTAVVPTSQEPPNVDAPYQVYTASAYGVDIDIYYPTYIWVDLGPVSSLFTTGDDTVDFNNLTSDQQATVAGGADLYDGLGGNDVVTLPNVANYNESVGDGQTLDWDPSQTFTTGSLAGQTYTIYGGDGSYNIALGAGNDTVSINGNGDSTISAGSGTDTIAITGDGDNTIALGSGTDSVKLSGSGNGTITGGDGSYNIALGAGDDTINLTGAGPNTIHVGTGPETINLSGSQQCTIDFTGDNETITLNNLSGFTGSIIVNGFTSNDEIDFTEPNLTTCATFNAEKDSTYLNLGVNGELDVYSSQTKIATLVFATTADVTQLEPVAGPSGRTRLILAPSTVAKANYQGSANQGQVLWTFVRQNEGNELEPYVPLLGHSGVTIGTGVDLANGGITQAVFQSLFLPYAAKVGSDQNLTLLWGAAQKSLTLQSAVSYLSSNGATITNSITNSQGVTVNTVQSISSSITPSQANVLANYAEEAAFNTAVGNWTSNSGVSFYALKPQIQTVLVDEAYNRGSGLDVIAVINAINDVISDGNSGSSWDAVTEAIQATALSSSRKKAEIGLLNEVVAAGGNPLAQVNNGILFHNASGQAAVWEMNGTSITGGGTVSSNPGPSWKTIGTGDFFGGGSSDILWQNTNGQAAIWEMNGTSLIGGGTVSPNPGPSWQAIGTGDFNGDGLSDILWQNTNGQAAIWEMNGANVIGGGSVTPNPGPSWQAIGTGDFNDDGYSDILWQNANGQVAIWEMNGNDVVGGGAVSLNPGPAWKAIGTGDFNYDGHSDMLFQNTSSGQVAIWELNGTNIIGGGVLSADPGPSWRAIGTGGEGSSDILFQNTSGQTAIWDMNGTTIAGGGVVSTNPGPSWKAIGLS